MGSAQKQPSRVTVSDSKRLRKPNKIHGCSTQELLGRGCRALSSNLSDHPSCGECKLKVTHCTNCHPARQWATVREDFSGKLESTRCVKRLLRERAQHSEDKGTYKPFQYLMVWGHVPASSVTVMYGVD